MYLTKLEVIGFKSFVNKTVFDFSKGVTAIVGPNGSGKSNVADAIRWALGEQSFKNLRGRKVDDIIFAGTEKRRPLSFCEVSITFDNSDEFFEIDYNELVITRRAYRSGENEYYINGNSCRLKDITMLLHDTGVGKEGYSIIGQNKIETLINNKSEHMREVLDEAAGVMKYKARKIDAERKLSRTQTNIERIEDMLETLGVQLEPLAIQSTQAKEYFETRDKLKSLEATAFFNNFDNTEKKRERLVIEQNDLAKNIEDHKNNIELTAKEINDTKSKEQELENKLSVYQQEIMEMSGRIERQKGDIQLFEQKVEYIKENSERLNKEIKDLREQEDNKQKQLVSLEDDAKKVIENLSSAKDILSASKLKYEEANVQVIEAEGKLDRDKAELMNKINKASEAKMQATRLNTMNSGIDERLVSIKAEKERLIPLTGELEEETAQLESSEKRLNQKQKDLSAEYNEVTSKILEIKTFKESVKEKEHELEKKMSESMSRIKVMEDMQKTYEGFNMPIKRLMQYSKKNQELEKKILGVVANVINVPEKYSKAIESTLGAALQNIISKDENDAKYIINCLRQNSFGIATILPLNVIKPRVLNAQDRSVINDTGCLGVASDLISCDAKYTNIISYLLGRTLIVDNMDNAIKIARRIRHSLKIVTLSGDIINPGGSMTGGGRARKTAGILEREQVLKQEKLKLNDLKKALSELKEKASKINALDELSLRQQRIAQEINDCNIAVAIEKEKLDTVKVQFNEKQGQISALENELEQLSESKKNIEEQLASIDEEHVNVENDNKEFQNKIMHASKELAEFKRNVQVLLTDFNEKNAVVTNLEKEYAILINKITDRKSELANINVLMLEKQNMIDENIAGLDKMLENNKTSNDQEATLQSEINDKKNELETLRNIIAELKQDQQTLNDNIQKLNKLIEDKQDRRHKIEMQMLKMQNDIDTATKTLYAEFELTVEQAKEIYIKEPVKNINSKISELRSRLRSIGVINPNAIEDYNNVKSRYDELFEQKEDLLTAKTDLERIVKDLYKGMNKQFNTEFDKLNTLFNETFREVFGGGRAEIKMLDESDKLNSPVEIIAQPPGKKLGNMLLLSGGESALTAISLMLSVIKLRPTPFCVLDEIEASLDEANTYKLANYIKRYSDTSQFILITHQKASMASSDTLYGVAMEEKGVSRIVSVKMEEYDQEKAV